MPHTFRHPPHPFGHRNRGVPRLRIKKWASREHPACRRAAARDAARPEDIPARAAVLFLVVTLAVMIAVVAGAAIGEGAVRLQQAAQVGGVW